jgi:SAM-dependent methyltransferase
LAGARQEAPDFGAIAASYDRLRPVDEKWWEVFETLVREGDLGGRRTLDLACGTGTLSGALAELGGKVWGVDASAEMLAQARASHTGPRFKEGRAEALPFKDAWFDRVVVRLGLHLFDRPRALAEIARVLVPGGRVALATFDPDHFAAYWLAEYFPSLVEIDCARFPDPATVVAELEAAGFTAVRVAPLRQEASLAREEALERIRGRYISTLRLLDEDEFERGLALAERTLPGVSGYRLEWLIVSAERQSLDAVRQRG